MLKKWIDFWLFGNFHIATITMMMVYCTQKSFHLTVDFTLLGFVFCATMSSYSLHWFLTDSDDKRQRNIWNSNNKKWLKILFIVHFCLLFLFFPFILKNINLLFPLIFLTFLYTAPKIPYSFFSKLKNFAFGKTFYLAFVWCAVTVLLPIYNSQIIFDQKVYYFFCNRLLFLLPICMLFDYRDRNEDYGIQNLVTYFNEKTINLVFAIQVTLFLSLSFYLNLNWRLWLPIGLLIIIFSKSKKTNNDYWYYGILDSTLMVSGILFLF